MFSVIFEVHPKPDRWNEYLALGKMLRPDLEQIDGFIENVRYRSLSREGWLISLSGWRDEKALVRWRTHAIHHGVQEKGRREIFFDYHLRVGQLTRDTRPPEGHELSEPQADEMLSGLAATAILIDAAGPINFGTSQPIDVANELGLSLKADGLVAWDVFDAVLTPGDALLLTYWRGHRAAEMFLKSLSARANTRIRCVRIIRDYGMFDRREAPQFYPDVEGAATIHF